MESIVERCQPHRVIRCWACEEFLALVSRDHQLILEADAETTSAGSQPVIQCPCGARTILPDDRERPDR